ncbi:thrombospondin type 3 repeat-containing protein [Chryseobacterium sp. Tr-659]|uniref:thrombospondin type 3 repeat-containing protein n=1 Tax=Chryseobacterium sp. Tr-659 TaxID=2608340 RepID=UPI001887475E|nr:thrombospondin type 3 repeat-containing protein [Chryseobacterium sp. Tr-659]
MKIIYFALPFLFFSCSQSVEQRCLVNNRKDVINDYEEQKSYTVNQILNEKPEYLEIVNLKKYRSFKKDSAVSHSYESSKESEDIFSRQEKEFKIFSDHFSDQFLCYSQQQIGNILYGLGRNRLGFWLLSIENGKANAHFLGLSFSHYYINEIQENPMIRDGFLQLEGSLVKIIKVAGLPGYDDYSAIEDGKLFRINIERLKKDTDGDGYNDIFEKSFGLNPENKDTDGDGINDFEDMNPMFKSGNNKFTQLYELLLPGYGNANMKRLQYTFEVYKTDCDYFHQINPELRVLFMPESKGKQTYYTRMTDVTDETISKIQKNNKDPKVFYIYKSGNSFGNDYSAEYENGKWKLTIVGGYVV